MENYKKFIKKANSNNIVVYALGGSPNWIYETKEVAKFCKWVMDYEKGASPKEAFKGIHIDVEPYLTNKWEEDIEHSIELYQDVLMKLKNTIDDTLVFGVDIPFWFDTVSYTNSSHGSGVLSDWIIKNVDEITIMAYRNFAEGANGINHLINREVLLANKLNKSIIVGVETQKLPESHVSFYNQSPKELEKALSEVTKTYENYRSFDGFAIHYYQSYKEFINP
ncbi:hypothetical protein RYX56_18800 [Alkalihalophilus lindianensis]|uniref:Uncharacterized protein n=1 Tax=Alkalihalophilus lindianensis TaxID=1630542 RepID=A0ABU3XEV1_9BACI|nr:hypothetical protein [Alkalihalophilus lindianensis]MDV2686422.1 hypothetical protein [Alkalihalophilus lindianensis]